MILKSLRKAPWGYRDVVQSVTRDIKRNENTVTSQTRCGMVNLASVQVNTLVALEFAVWTRSPARMLGSESFVAIEPTAPLRSQCRSSTSTIVSTTNGHHEQRHDRDSHRRDHDHRNLPPPKRQKDQPEEHIQPTQPPTRPQKKNGWSGHRFHHYDRDKQHDHHDQQVRRMAGVATTTATTTITSTTTMTS